MQDAFIHKTERPWPNRRLKIAAIVGHTTATTSRIWVRTGALGKFCLLYFRAEQASEKWFDEAKAQTPFPIDQLPAGVRKSDEFDSVWDNDATAVVELSDLAAGASWRYALCRIAPENSPSREARLVLGHDRAYSFRTPSPTRDFRFALFSCHMPFKAGGLFSDKTEIANMDIWDIMSRALRHRRDNGNDLDFVIAGGDQCYVDGIPTLDIWRYLNKVMRKEGGRVLPSEETMTQWYRDIYRGYWGFDSVRRTVRVAPDLYDLGRPRIGRRLGLSQIARGTGRSVARLRGKRDFARRRPGIDCPHGSGGEAGVLRIPALPQSRRLRAGNSTTIFATRIAVFMFSTAEAIGTLAAPLFAFLARSKCVASKALWAILWIRESSAFLWFPRCRFSTRRRRLWIAPRAM